MPVREAIVCDENGLAVFEALLSHKTGQAASLCAFDVTEIGGRNLRRIEDRKFVLKKLLRRSHPGITLNRHFDIEGLIVFFHACKLGCEGIVSKRLDSWYRAGRSSDWLKTTNPAAPAVKRKALEWRR